MSKTKIKDAQIRKNQLVFWTPKNLKFLSESKTFGTKQVGFRSVILTEVQNV